MESLVARAEASGCDALVVTLDTTMLGWRPRDLDLGHLPFAQGKGIAQYTSDPVFRRLVEQRASSPAPAAGGASAERDRQPRPTLAAVRALVGMARAWPGPLLDNLRSPLPRAAVETFLGIYSRPSITWADLAWLRARTRLPIVLKGVLHPDDARRALDEGVDGVVVSTHGGRQVDRSIAALDALPDVVDAVGRPRAGAAGQRRAQRRRRPGRGRPRAPARCCSAGPTSGVSAWPARTASARWCPTSWASST